MRPAPTPRIVCADECYAAVDGEAVPSAFLASCEEVLVIVGKRRVLVPWTLALVAGCGSGPNAPTQPVCHARVAITDLTVGLTKTDGRPWDGPAGSVSAH